MSARAMKVLRDDAHPAVAAYIDAHPEGVWIADPDFPGVWGWFADPGARPSTHSPFAVVYLVGPGRSADAYDDFEISDEFGNLLAG